MKKSEAINTFAQGLVMDINPLVAPNDGVCNALNATLITMNGNENVLQNDMGNGRVETAFLPEGYVPLGTTELGGIIYIVSYNPLNKKCQIGSFPSPERNISTDKISDLNQALDNTDFKYDTQTDPQTGAQIGAQTGALVYYLKKELNEGLTFNPGDKFIVYGDTIDANFANLYDEASYDQSLYNDSLYDQSLSKEEIKKKIQEAIEIIKNHTLKLDIGTVTDTGKLVKFENLKQYNIGYKDTTDTTEDTTDTTKKIQGKYHIFQYSGEDTQNPDLDEYRSLVSQPYNIFSSKISGSLVLIAELVQFNDFDVQLEHAFTISNGHKVYAPKATFTFSGDYPFIPKGVICEVSLVQNDKEIKSKFDYNISDDDIIPQLSHDNTFYEVNLNQILTDKVLEEIQKISKNGYFDLGERNGGYIIKYKFTPCMNWGPVSYLAVTGQIDLDKLGTGYIEVNQWRYYNEENKCNLTWGLEIYEEEGHTVDKVTMKFTRFVTPTSTEFVIYKVNNKSSYFGVFYDVLPIGEDYYRLTGRLKPNCLYLVEIQVDYKSTDKNSSKPKTFYRWLYTNAVFNKYYTNTDDFQTLQLDFTPKFKINYNNIVSSSQSKAYGIIRKVVDGLTDEEKETLKDSISSLSAIQTKNDSSIDGSLSIGLVKDYNTFYLEANKNAFGVTLNENSVNCTSSSDIKYSDIEDSNQDKFLKSGEEIAKSDDEFDKYIIGPNSSGNDISGKLKDLPTNVLRIRGTFNPEFKDNSYTFSLSYSSLHTVKAYCTKIISDLTYKGKFIPLAYDTTTFQDYNLEWDDTKKKWVPFTVGTFGFKEDGGHRGRSYIGGWNKTGKDSKGILIKKENNLDFHWTTDVDIPSAQVSSGWSGTSMFFIHKWAEDTGDNIQNIGKPVNAPQNPENDKNVYSYPYNRTGHVNRVQLSLKSNKGDDFYYPINCSAFYSSDTKMTETSDIFNIEKFCNLFNDFAQYLNNIYRYDLEGTTQQWIIPEFIYWMDNCKYSLSMSLNVESNNTLNKDAVVYLMLDEGKLELSKMVDKLIEIGYLEDKDYPTLQPNISSTIQEVNNSFTINIVDSDNISGIEMRNYMLDCMKTTLSSAIMDYDGTKILATTNILANNKYLYMRNDTNGNPSIALATNFIPKKIKYTSADSNIIPSVDTSGISPWIDEDLFNIQELNLNRYFTLNNDNILVLKDPKSTEHEFKRNSDHDDGIIDGYLNLYILYKYKSY